MSRPLAAEGLLEAVQQAVPERVRTRLDKGNPADGWTWATSDAGGTVTTDTGETVTLGPAPVSVEALTCSCLLNPRCFHVLAVAASLPVPAAAAPEPEVPAGPARPAPAEGLLDEVSANVPERVKKRLGDPNPADAWTWEQGADGWVVRTDGGDLVKVAAEPVTAGALSCSCLLAPRCLHVLAVATAIAKPGAAAATAPTAAPSAPAPEPEPPPEEQVALDGGQRAVVAAMTRAALAVLAAGANGVGTTAREDLSRAVHSCRAVGLHRMARAGRRVLTQIRDLQARRPAFTLTDLAEDLRELLLVAHLLGEGRGPRSAIGTGRRSYAGVGTLRLYGLCTEPIVSAAGYGGTATLLCDAQGRIWTVSDVMPTQGTGAGRARDTYQAPASVGGATLPHRQLARQGLFVQDATASEDGRLGSGKGVKAVRSGPSAWTDDGPARRFAEGALDQLRAAARGQRDLLFLRGVVLGADDDGLLIGVEGLRRPLRGLPALDHTELSFLENLRLLARAEGLPLRLIARPAPRRHTVSLLAVGPDDPIEGAPRLVLPDDWGGRCNLGHDRLLHAHLEGDLVPVAQELALPDEGLEDPLVTLRRRVQRMALGGRATLPGDVRATVDREASWLRAHHLGTAADALSALADEAASGTTREGLAQAWLRATLVDQTVGRALAAALL
ncbi:MAG: SWIM zinc finger family protein [Alphaproteobacteria bacterium]|nr:SWIM zinc finger family protein [Alphaproteobacteria bacterium]MCB9688155.1 SWIM zinc finger family protein [Alphaproteobacteria bacterium]